MPKAAGNSRRLFVGGAVVALIAAMGSWLLLLQTLHGAATFLRAPLTIEQPSIDGEWLRFTTRSHEMLGSDSPRKEVTHRYMGRVMADGILFTLESGGGYSIHPPIEFVVHRLAPVP